MIIMTFCGLERHCSKIEGEDGGSGAASPSSEEQDMLEILTIAATLPKTQVGEGDVRFVKGALSSAIMMLNRTPGNESLLVAKLGDVAHNCPVEGINDAAVESLGQIGKQSGSSRVTGEVLHALASATCNARITEVSSLTGSIGRQLSGIALKQPETWQRFLRAEFLNHAQSLHAQPAVLTTVLNAVDDSLWGVRKARIQELTLKHGLSR